MRSKDVSAVIVTRGDVDLKPVLDTLSMFDDIVIWDNRVRYNVLLYGRYVAMREVRNSVVYVQDDDCTLTPEAIEMLISEYRRGEVIANMPVSRWADYPDSCLVGWGAVFDRTLPREAFERYARRYPLGATAFMRDCDLVFTTLTPHIKLDLGFTHLPWAEMPYRLFRQPEHAGMRERILHRAREVRDAVPM